jgi:hypothetical protein
MGIPLALWIQLVLQYGLPEVVKMIEIFQKQTITDADVAVLKQINPPSVLKLA